MEPRAPITAGLGQLLRNAIDNIPVGVVVAPPEGNTEPPTVPYLIITPRDAVEIRGPAFFDPHADICFPYDVTCVGARADQAEAVADAVAQAIIGRDAQGEYVTAWPDPAHPVADRRLRLIGQSNTSDDTRLAWVVVDVGLDSMGG